MSMSPMALRLAGIAMTVVGGFIGYQVLAADQPGLSKALDDLTGKRTTKAALAPDQQDPGSVNIEFVVDQCEARPDDLPALSSLVEPAPPTAVVTSGPAQAQAPVPHSPPEPLPEPVAPAKVELPAPVAPEPLDATDELVVAPEAVLPSLADLEEPEPVPLQSRALIQISPSIVYLP